MNDDFSQDGAFGKIAIGSVEEENAMTGRRNGNATRRGRERAPHETGFDSSQLHDATNVEGGSCQFHYAARKICQTHRSSWVLGNDPARRQGSVEVGSQIQTARIGPCRAGRNSSSIWTAAALGQAVAKPPRLGEVRDGPLPLLQGGGGETSQFVTFGAGW